MHLRTSLAATYGLLVFGVATYLSYLLVADELVYFQRGESTQAVVLHKKKELPKNSDDGSSWYVAYEFEIDGRNLENKNMLDLGRGFDSVNKGDLVDVIYDPRDPKTNRMHLAAPMIRYPMTIFFIFAMGGVITYAPLQIFRK